LVSIGGGEDWEEGGAGDDEFTGDHTAHELFLGEEEIFDTSLSTFYVFDKENAGANSLAQDLKLAFGCGGCCGCPGCALTWPTEKSEGGSVAGVHRRHERREHRRGHHTGSSSSGSSSSSSPK
jgi:hypothetical protein